MKNTYKYLGEEVVIPTIEQSGKIYSLSQLINKEIYAFSGANVYRLPYAQETLYFLPETFSAKWKKIVSTISQEVYTPEGAVYKKVKEGDSLGTFISLSSAGNKVYCYFGDGRAYYIKGFNYNFAQEYFLPFRNLLYKVSKGDRLGKLDTWVNSKKQIVRNGNLTSVASVGIFLSFRINVDGKIISAYTPADKNIVDTKIVEQQGAKTEEELKAEEEDKNKTWYEKLLENLGGGVKKLLIGGAVVFVAVKLGQTLIQTRAERKQLPAPDKK